MGRQPGFTLLEIIIALLVIGLSLTTIISVQNKNVQASAEAKELALGTMLAQRIIDETEAAGNLQLGHRRGNFAGQYSAFFWEKEVQPGPLESLRNLRVTVGWSQGRTTKVLTLSRYVFMPGGEP